MKLSTLIGLVGTGALSSVLMTASTQKARDVSFDRDVMPILSQRCFKCHGPDASKAAGGLRLDSLELATNAKGDRTALVPGSPERSYLLTRIVAGEMPPKDSGMKPLAPDQIETLRLWIKQGAKYEKHWSYVPPVMPSMPKVSRPDWCRNFIDLFVLAKLDESKLMPEPEADKDTLAVRAAETLTGLPPSLGELAAFRNDKNPGAYERFVDRLLAKPEFGEHVARYWLDAVRYGDTHGLQLDNERGIFPYRDWVVRAFNKDIPFDQFVTWQLAGDLLPSPTTEQLIATGYIRMNLTSNEGGAIAEEFLARNTFDRVETSGTVLMGLTLQCARCHDHKYDPIRQKDYYGLYAFFNSTADEPLDGNIAFPPPVMSAPSPDQESALRAMSQSLQQLRDKVEIPFAVEALEKGRTPFPETSNWQISPVYTSKSFDEEFDKPEPPESGENASVEWIAFPFVPGKPYSGIIGRDRSAVYVRGHVRLPEPRTVAFGVSSDDAVKVWLNGKLIHSNKVSRGISDAIDEVKGDFKQGDNTLLIKVVNGAGPDGISLRFGSAAEVRIDTTLKALRENHDAVDTQNELRSLYLEFGPENGASKSYRELLRKLTALKAAIPMTLIASELPTPRPTTILRRGLYDQKGDPVTRQVPSFLGELPKGSRPDRLGFARWLTFPTNPLFARVFVNRVWQQFFGTAIIKTAEDFGSQGEWPLNRPLLDSLAVTFAKNGWSVKKLCRTIVTSATFRQSSKISAAKLTRDPENRLLARGPRFRLDAEVIRDKALFSGGLLRKLQGGRGFKPYQPDGIWESATDPASGTYSYTQDKDDSIYRRSLYLFWKRTAPPPAMISLDAPLRDTCVVRRSSTNTPLQALTVQNETAFLESARLMAVRLLAIKGTDEERMKRAFDIALSRNATKIELGILIRALVVYRQQYTTNLHFAESILKVGTSPQQKGIAPAEQAAWMLICSTLMNTDEFLTLH